MARMQAAGKVLDYETLAGSEEARGILLSYSGKLPSCTWARDFRKRSGFIISATTRTVKKRGPADFLCARRYQVILAVKILTSRLSHILMTDETPINPHKLPTSSVAGKKAKGAQLKRGGNVQTRLTDIYTVSASGDAAFMTLIGKGTSQTPFSVEAKDINDKGLTKAVASYKPGRPQRKQEASRRAAHSQTADDADEDVREEDEAPPREVLQATSIPSVRLAEQTLSTKERRQTNNARIDRHYLRPAVMTLLEKAMKARRLLYPPNWAPSDHVDYSGTVHRKALSLAEETAKNMESIRVELFSVHTDNVNRLTAAIETLKSAHRRGQRRDESLESLQQELAQAAKSRKAYSHKDAYAHYIADDLLRRAMYKSMSDKIDVAAEELLLHYELSYFGVSDTSETDATTLIGKACTALKQASEEPGRCPLPNSVHVYNQSNAWVDGPVMERVLEDTVGVWKDSLPTKAKESPPMLILDHAPAHRTASFQDGLRRRGVAALYVPRDFTGKLQVLDVAVFSAYRQNQINAAGEYSVKAKTRERTQAQIDLYAAIREAWDARKEIEKKTLVKGMIKTLSYDPFSDADASNS